MATIVVRSQEYGVIREALYRKRRAMTPLEVSNATGINERVVVEELTRLVKDERVVLAPVEGNPLLYFMHEYWARFVKPAAKKTAKKTKGKR